MEKGWVQISVKPRVYNKLVELKNQMKKTSISDVISYLIEEYEKKTMLSVTQ